MKESDSLKTKRVRWNKTYGTITKSAIVRVQYQVTIVNQLSDRNLTRIVQFIFNYELGGSHVFFKKIYTFLSSIIHI